MKTFICLSVLFAVSYGINFRIKNKSGQEMWIGIQGNPTFPHLEGGGFKLGPGQERNVPAQDNWAGRFWARTGCDGGSNHCETGDCGNRLQCGGNGGSPPVSLAEITMKGWGGIDYYDISLVDGSNVPVYMDPLNKRGSTGQKYSCERTKCDRDLNPSCPEELKQKVGGRTVGCMSACLRYNTDQYCCRGAHDQPHTCRATDWPRNYPKFFKDACPDAYSYAYDDHKSTYTCKETDYEIAFG